MSTLQIQLELSAEVYPELYAALRALDSASSRNERMRQLASAGLVWENVRIYGAAAIGPTPAPPPAITASPTRKTKPSAQKNVAPVTPPTLNELLTPAPVAPQSHQGSDFHVELSPSDVEQIVNELPVLIDIVGDGGPSSSKDLVIEAQSQLPYSAFTTKQIELDNQPTFDETEVDTFHLVSLAQKPAMRSRLIRMKERGLFKNG